MLTWAGLWGHRTNWSRMARRRSASGSHSSAEMRWRRARGRRSLSTGTMFNTQITLRKSIVWAEVVGFGFPSFTLWESCFHGAADSCSLTFSFREFPPSPRLLFPLIRDIKVMKNLSALIEPAATMNQTSLSESCHEHWYSEERCQC